MAAPGKSNGTGFFGSAAGWVFCAFAVIALFFVLAEHRAHLGLALPYVPFALLGLCVVLHSYMHGALYPRPPSSDQTPGHIDVPGRDANPSEPHHPHSHS